MSCASQRGAEKLFGRESCWRGAIAAKPSFAEAYNNLGAVLKARGAFADAEGAFQQALVLNPNGYTAGTESPSRRTMVKTRKVPTSASATRPKSIRRRNSKWNRRRQ